MLADIHDKKCEQDAAAVVYPQTRRTRGVAREVATQGGMLWDVGVLL